MTKVEVSKKKEKIKDWRLLEFYVPIDEKLQESNGDFLIKGVAINETTTLNNVKYVAEELTKAAPSFRNVPILLDHENRVKNIVGRTTENVDFNTNFKRIDFEGKIMDKDIREMIRDGRINNVSIGAKVQDLVEEEDGSMKAIGIQGLEISLVAVPGDTHANLAQAIQNSFHLKEMAMEEDKEELEEKKVSGELNDKEVKMSEEETKVDTATEEVKDENKEEVEVEVKAEEKVKENLDISEMKKQISELKDLLIQKKKMEEDITKEKIDNTKGEVSVEKVEALENLNNYIVERANSGFALYRDYNKESADTKLKRLVR